MKLCIILDSGEIVEVCGDLTEYDLSKPVARQSLIADILDVMSEIVTRQGKIRRIQH